MEQLFWIDIKYACYGIIAKDGKVVAAPPIASWMVHKALTTVLGWLNEKKAVVEEIKPAPQAVKQLKLFGE